jgi:CRP-like cAMP-binding protein
MTRRLGAKEQRLASVPMFAACSPDELQLLARLADEIHLRAGEQVIGAGELGREFFIIENGSVRVVRFGREVAELGSGDYFGELALLGEPVRNADVVAVTDVDLVVMTSTQFSGLLDEVPTLARTLLRGMAHRLAEADRRPF